MLTDDERRDIEVEIDGCENAESASVEALRVLQRHRGWVSDEAVKDIAPLLDMSPDKLDGVATLYSFIFRRPVGRHVIFVCDSVSCYVMGYETLLDHLSRRLGIGMGETTPDNRFTLLPVSCIGLCDHAPALVIDDDPYGDLDSGKLDEILKKYT